MLHDASPPSEGYSANGFPPELKGRVVSGRLFLGHDGARFESPTARVVLPLQGLQLRRGGHNHEQLFLEHPQFPGWSIYSGDERLPNDPVLRSIPSFSSQLRSLQKSRKSIPAPVTLGLALMAVFFGALLILFLQKDKIVQLVVDRIPVSMEMKFGDQVFEQIKAEGKIIENSPWEPRVKEITGRLLSAVGSSDYELKFHLMNDTNINAFAIPGGNIVILTGLLDAAESAEEVAGVLAHEIAHVTKRHSLRQMVQSAGLIVLIQAIFGDTSGIAAIMTEGSRYLLQQRFSRDFEREADDIGWSYLLTARIDPRGMNRFFEKLREMYQSSGAATMESTLALLNTHPATTERIDRLESKWRDLARKDDFVPFSPWTRPQLN